jgi:hypothetical protein
MHYSIMQQSKTKEEQNAKKIFPLPALSIP